MKIKLICPYCGSTNVETFGGEDGDPFNSRKQTAVCADCGRSLDFNDEPHFSVKIPSCGKKIMDAKQTLTEKTKRK